MARTPEKNMEMRNRSKEKIREAALSQFARKGLFATRIQDIAEEAGISQGLLYRHYKSKAEIYSDLIEDALDKLNDASLKVRDLDMDSGKKIRLALDELFKTIKQSERFRQTSRLIAQSMNSEAIPERIQLIIDEKREVPYLVFADIMAKGQCENLLVDGDPYELSVLFWSTVNGLATFVATRKGVEILPEVDRVMSMFLKPQGGSI